MLKKKSETKLFQIRISKKVNISLSELVVIHNLKDLKWLLDSRGLSQKHSQTFV